VRVVIALGGNALLKRGEPMTAEAQRANVRIAAQTIAPLVRPDHELVITHGNGPQVGLLALQGAAYKPDEAYPLDVLGAETEGMIGYMIEQEFGNVLPFEVPFATILTMVEVDPDDPGFKNPTKFVGPVYDKPAADRIAAEKGWVFKQDGDKWRRVVPSPLPRRIFELRPIKWLLEHKTVVICAGGGGIPTMYKPGGNRELIGVEAVIDKDLCRAAREGAQSRLARDADRCGCGLPRLGKPTQRAIRTTTPKRSKASPSPQDPWGRRSRRRAGSSQKPAQTISARSRRVASSMAQRGPHLDSRGWCSASRVAGQSTI
jgi:carbamate kinase